MLLDPPVLPFATENPQLDKKKLIGLPPCVYGVHTFRGPHWCNEALGLVDEYKCGIVAPPTYCELEEWAYLWATRPWDLAPPFAPWRTSIVHYRSGAKAYLKSGTDEE